MKFDIFTALAASCAMTGVLGALLLFFWLRDRKTSWLVWWSAGYTGVGLGMAVFMLEPLSPDNLNSALGSSVIVAALWFLWQGARAFEHREIIFWPLAAALVSQMVLPMPGIFDHSLSRLAVASLPKILFLSLTAYEFWRGRAEILPSRLPMVFTLAFMSVFLAIRIPLSHMTIYPGGNGEPNQIWVGTVATILFFVSVALVMMINAMTLERREVRQKFAAQSDPLTGLLNRRALYETFGDGPLPDETSVVVFDLDHFKDVNDTYGHAIGDECLRVFTRICRQNIRQVDIAVRLGGEEFAVVMSNTSVAVALVIAERIRRTLAKTPILTESGPLRCKVSAGVHVVAGEVLTLDQLLQRADDELYYAKRSGRNRVCFNSAAAAAA